MDQDQGPARADSEGDKADAEKESSSSSSIGDEPGCTHSQGAGDPKDRNSPEAANPGTLRKGKWTVEEEEYTSRIIHYFNTGLLTLPEGATLRSYLAEKLNCDPMRVTKKYAGASCLGRRVYHFHNRPQPTVAQIQLAGAELDLLEQRFRQRVEEAPALPIPMAGSAAALQALLVNMAAAAAAAAPPPQTPPVNINPSSLLFGANQQAMQQPLVQPNVLAANAIIEALAKQSQQQPSFESTIMNLAVARAAASLSAPAPATQQLNILNQLLAQNHFVLNGGRPTQFPAQQVASALPAAQAPVPTPSVVTSQPALASLSGDASGPPSSAISTSTANAESYTEQLKRTFEAHLRANNIPFAHLAGNQSASPQVLCTPTGQAPALPALHSSPQPSAAVCSTRPFNAESKKAAATKNPPPLIKPPKNPTAGNVLLSQKARTSKAGKGHSRHLQAKASRFASKSATVRSGNAESAADANGAKPRTEEEKAAGTILIGFLSSLRDSYEDALRSRGEATRQEESDEFTYDPRTGAASQAATVTDWSTQQPESSIDDSDWNSDKKTDPSSSEDSDKEEREGRRSSGSQGPPRKRLKRIAMESNNSGYEQDRD